MHQSGAHYVHIKKKVKKLKRKYKDITLVCGTNNCSTGAPVEKITDECKDLITVAKEKAQNVHLCSVPPRTDGRADSAKIDEVNRSIEVLAERENIHFVNNDENFKYRDGSVDKNTLLTDGLHLSKEGLDRLIKNVGLSDVAESKINQGPTNKWQQKNNQNTSDFQKKIPGTSRTNNTRHGIPNKSGDYMRFGQGGGDREKPESSSFHDIRQRQHRFKGADDSYSNFSPCPVWINDHWYPTSEHAYQHRKAIVMKQWLIAEMILQAETPQEAKFYGDMIETDAYWYSIKADVMYEIILAKVEHNPDFAQRLRDSKGIQLIEATRNEYWAEGKNGTGLNMLGRVLMSVREKLCMYTDSNRAYDSSKSKPVSQSEYNQCQPACFKCGEKNHVTHVCMYDTPIKCYKCGRLGHKEKFCRR